MSERNRDGKYENERSHDVEEALEIDDLMTRDKEELAWWLNDALNKIRNLEKQNEERKKEEINESNPIREIFDVETEISEINAEEPEKNKEISKSEIKEEIYENLIADFGIIISIFSFTSSAVLITTLGPLYGVLGLPPAAFGIYANRIFRED